MLRTTLEQWRMFKAVVDHGSFNQAAVIIHKSQSTIHHAVHKLEEVLGVSLLTTKGRKTALTEAGELMLRRANYLLEEAAKLEAIAGTLGSGIETKINIAVDAAFPHEELYKVLETVSTQYPLLRIELIETTLSGTNELIAQGLAEIGLSTFPMTNGLNEEICQINFIAVAYPEHTLHTTGHKLKYEDLKSHRQIVIRDSAMNTNTDSGWLGAEQRWTVSHLRTSIDLVSKGFGFAWLPEPSIRPLLEEGLLRPLNSRARFKAYRSILFKL
ncbi:LysR family transcriptional regulator [Zooshikella harenae]|uniref:LysR family transcriptional regulator n=1 Tax=Zooshikella harenae TaxID=2827238 RepID=A0ABS5Z6F5_9GAMM|nr:LysR family transcriptional regulator [Zooshikella harenae]MBU2709640.1 LysR family transcriptional regulator [Zooshikella harenae]